MSTAELRFEPSDTGFWSDPYPLYRRLRDEDPVHRVDRKGFFVLSRFADVYAAANDTQKFSSAQGLTFEEDEIVKLGLAPTLVMMDRPAHTVYRRLVNQMFTPREVAKLEHEVRAFVRERISRIAEQGEADWVEELAGPLPGLVVAHYLGVPASDRGTFGEWSGAIVQANATGTITQAVEAVSGLYSYFTELAERRRNDPSDDMISLLLSSRIEERPVTEEEILGFCFVMVAGGNDTASGLLSESAAALSRFPDERRRLLEQPALVPGAVVELLRFSSPVQGLSRTTTQEVSVDGTTIPEGTKVHLLYASANRDEREFGESSESLDVTRKIARMVSFGSGPHHCLGAAAAKLQGRVVVEELLGAMPDFVACPDEGNYAPGPFTRRFEHLPIRARP